LLECARYFRSIPLIKSELAVVPLIGRIFGFVQCLMVDRSAVDKSGIFEAIHRRSGTNQKWRQA
jgi:1-acyl-sn-glycerol-3-phosphate acyltransferase